MSNYQEIIQQFERLCQWTTSHGYESMLFPFIFPFIPDIAEWWIDDDQNFHVLVPSIDDDKTPKIMWTSHLDTCTMGPPVSTDIYILHDKEGRPFYHCTPLDGANIVLGADCKTGATIMCFMMKDLVPGWYVFFAGEEQGCIGSGRLSNDMKTWPMVPNKVVSFDRMGTGDLIHTQFGGRCASQGFIDYVCAHSPFDWQGAMGAYTDSSQFVDDVPECTNVSVGYYNQHTDRECQDIGYMVKLTRWMVSDGWKVFRAAPTIRKPGTSKLYRGGFSQIQGMYGPDAEEVLEDYSLELDDMDDWDMNKETFDQWVERRQQQSTDGDDTFDPILDQSERDRQAIEQLSDDEYQERV